MEIISAIQVHSPFHFHFQPCSTCPNPLLRIENGLIAYGSKIILNNINLSIAPKDRIALLGPNGAGKSSFIKTLALEMNLITGVRESSPGLKIGYFAQHQIERLNLEISPLLSLKMLAPLHSEQSLRTFLGSFGFTGQRVLEKIRHFSGGEKSRLALALLIWEKPNLLLLDEPTNHLDLEMRQALSLALQDYQGAMLLVSHDRFLIRSTVDQLLLVANGEIKNFDGDLHDYEQWLLNFRRDNSPSKPKKSNNQINLNLKAEQRNLLKKIKNLDILIEKIQREKEELEIILNDPETYKNNRNVVDHKDLLDKQKKLFIQLTKAEEDWLQSLERYDLISKN